MAKIMDPILPRLSILGYWSSILGSFGGPGSCQRNWNSLSCSSSPKDCAGGFEVLPGPPKEPKRMDQYPKIRVLRALG